MISILEKSRCIAEMTLLAIERQMIVKIMMTMMNAIFRIVKQTASNHLDVQKPRRKKQSFKAWVRFGLSITFKNRKQAINVKKKASNNIVG